MLFKGRIYVHKEGSGHVFSQYTGKDSLSLVGGNCSSNSKNKRQNAQCWNLGTCRSALDLIGSSRYSNRDSKRHNQMDVVTFEYH